MTGGLRWGPGELPVRVEGPSGRADLVVDATAPLALLVPLLLEQVGGTRLWDGHRPLPPDDRTLADHGVAPGSALIAG